MSTFVLCSLLEELYTCRRQHTSSDPDMHLGLSQVRLTGSTMFLAIVEYVSVDIHTA